MQLKDTEGRVIFELPGAADAKELVKAAIRVGRSLHRANFNSMSLSKFDFSELFLENATFRGAYLTDANFSHATLFNCSFFGATVQRAKFDGAKLQECIFNNADLSGATGFSNPSDFLKQFRQTRSGIYVYKAFGQTYNPPPTNWVIAKGSVIEETVNTNRTTECGCGVNFGTMEWIEENMGLRSVTVWECLIPWSKVSDIVVPLMTDGKARCSYLKLIKPVRSWVG